MILIIFNIAEGLHIQNHFRFKSSWLGWLDIKNKTRTVKLGQVGDLMFVFLQILVLKNLVWVRWIVIAAKLSFALKHYFINYLGSEALQSVSNIIRNSDRWMFIGVIKLFFLNFVLYHCNDCTRTYNLYQLWLIKHFNYFLLRKTNNQSRLGQKDR